MPTYEYVCPEGHAFEKFQKMTDRPRAKCPTCGKTATRKISGGAGLVFKGSGFYITDYGKDGKGPRKPAERELKERQLSPTLVSRTEIAGPGFINSWLAQDQLAAAHREILEAGPAYGRSTIGAGLKVNVEFVSANPTGPLHVGHGRGAALGDAIAALLEWTGHAVTREFYINDAGVQIDRVAESLWARVRETAGHAATIPEGGY